MIFIFVFYFFAVILAFLSYKSFRGGIDYLKFFKQELTKPRSNFTPFVSIIAPCRGLDVGLYENLSALFRQDFPSFEILFVVDDEADEAVKIIEEVSRKGAKAQRKQNQVRIDGAEKENIGVHPRSSAVNVFPSVYSRLQTENSVSSKFVVAGKANNCGQKVHNLREAVLRVSVESQIFVFVDSDARPSENWLKNLIAPLQDETISAASAYRWFVQKRGGFATHLRSVWNASIASALGADPQKNFCWGGSLAIRRETFEKLRMRERLIGTLSEDFTFTRVLREAKLPIYFVPQCLTATVEDCRFKDLVEFTTRQMKITRVYAPHLWKASLIGSFIFTFTFWTGVFLLFFITGWHFWLTLAFLFFVSAFSIAKAWLRLKAVKLVLTDYEKELNRQIFSQLTLWAISPILYFYNSMRALFSRRIIWRGIRYELESPTSTKILSNEQK